MTEIVFYLKFKDYDFRRAKRVGDGAIVYISKEWIGKEVSMIPVPYDVNDKMIERCRNEEGIYEVTMPSSHILNKTVAEGSNIGRAYVPKEYIGFDFLIIERPQYEYL